MLEFNPNSKTLSLCKALYHRNHLLKPNSRYILLETIDEDGNKEMLSAIFYKTNSKCELVADDSCEQGSEIWLDDMQDVIIFLQLLFNPLSNTLSNAHHLAEVDEDDPF